MIYPLKVNYFGIKKLLNAKQGNTYASKRHSMIRFKDVQIPKPCSVEYDLLHGDATKRFCGSCEKHVYDFRGKDDSYFSNIFLKNKKICGIFYEDQLSAKKSNSKNPIYASLVVKITSLILFVKSFFISHETKATDYYLPEASQIIISDSVGVQILYKKVSSRTRHHIDIYVNNEFIKTYYYPRNGFIYLPDSLKPDDKIKVKVIANKANIKTKTYRFKYSKSATFIIKITKKRELRLSKRRNYVGCPANFW